MQFREATRSEKLFVNIAEQIIEVIQKGEFSQGDLLPPERELALRFRVSRPVIREAIASLQLMGVVETKQGIGTFITKTNIEGSRDSLLQLENEESAQQVMETRMLVEPGAAKLAAERINKSELKRLQRLLEQMERIQEDAAEHSKLDYEFHREIAKASKNVVIEKLVESFIEYAHHRHIKKMREDNHEMKEDLGKQYYNQFRLIFDALAARDGESAELAMRLHLAATQKNWFAEI